MKLIERIDAALDRIASGQAPMRVPVEVTDVDVVLSACRSALSAAESKVDALMREKEEPWISIETLPAVGQIVLLAYHPWNNKSNSHCYVVGKRDEFNNWTGYPEIEGVDNLYPPTHWQAIRALVREQHKQDEDCASTRAGNHPSIEGG